MTTPHIPTTAKFNSSNILAPLAPLALALIASLLGGCDAGMGDIGLHPLDVNPAPASDPGAGPALDRQPAPEIGPAAAPDAQETAVLETLLQDFGLPMHKLNDAPVPSVAVPGSSLDVYIS